MEDEQNVDCYFRVKLTDCMKGVEIITYMDDMVMTNQVDEETETCLSAKCMKSDGSLSLTGEVIIGGNGIQSSPGTLEQSSTVTLLGNKKDCLASDAIAATVKCVAETSKG